MYTPKCVKMVVSRWHTRVNLTLEHQGHPCQLNTPVISAPVGHGAVPARCVRVSLVYLTGRSVLLQGPSWVLLLRAVGMQRKSGGLWIQPLFCDHETLGLAGHPWAPDFCQVEAAISPWQGSGGHQLWCRYFACHGDWGVLHDCKPGWWWWWRWWIHYFLIFHFYFSGNQRSQESICK